MRTQPTSDSGYDNYQSISGGGRGTSDSPVSIRTKSDVQFDATKVLLITASNLERAAKVLDDYTRLFINIHTSRNEIIAKSRQLKNIIRPMLSRAATSLNDISKSLAPIPSVKYLHDRNERKRVREVVDESNSRMSPELQLVSDYLLQEERKMKGVANSITPPKKRTKTNVTITPPSDGVQYRKSEVVIELRKYKKGSKEICTAMNDMINLGYVPCTVQTLRRMMSSDAEGKPTPDTPWTKGRIPIASLEEVQTMAEELQSRSGRGWSSGEISNMLVEIQSKKINDEGCVPLTTPTIDKKTVRNYTALLADQTNMSISQSCIMKTTTRNAAEHSLRGPICNLALIAYTHFIPVSNEDPDLRAELKRLPKSTQRLVDAVSASWGTHIVPVRPELIISTDDTTEYIFEGTKDVAPKFVLATKTSILKRGTSAIYRPEDSKAMNGMRVKLTFSFTAGGNSFPVAVTVLDLTKKEMPPGEDFIHVEIPGMCIGGGDVGVGVGYSQQVGHLFLMRSSEGAEKERFKYYQEHILIPGIHQQRKKYCDFDINDGEEIPDELTAVAWCDGDLSQIYATVNDIDQFTENKIIPNKQNAARSGVEQPADLCRVFKGIKSEISSQSVKDIPADRCPMKKLVMGIFDRQELKSLTLKPNKKNALIDFLATLPDILTKTCTRKNIVHGFLEAGKSYCIG